MRIEIARAELSRILGAVTRVVEPKSTYPILEHVLITAETDKVTVRGTDLDIEITVSAPAKCTPGACSAPAKRLADIAKHVAGDTVTMELQGDPDRGQTLNVKSGRSRFSLPTLPIDSFPDLNAGTFEHKFTADLSALFAPVKFAISDEDARYYLNGIYLHDAGGLLRAVATDGHRLSRFGLANLPDGAANMPGVIIPAKTVGIVPDGLVTIEVSNTKIRFTSPSVTAAAKDVGAPDTVILSKLIEGTFPDYDRVTPKNNDIKCSVKREDLLAAVGRVGLVASDIGGKAVRVSIAPDSMMLSAKSPEGGLAEDEVAAEYDGEPFAIGFNADYLGDALAALPDARVTFAFSEPGNPALLSGSDKGSIVIMPMRIAD